DRKCKALASRDVRCCAPPLHGDDSFVCAEPTGYPHSDSDANRDLSGCFAYAKEESASDRAIETREEICSVDAEGAVYVIVCSPPGPKRGLSFFCILRYLEPPGVIRPQKGRGREQLLAPEPRRMRPVFSREPGRRPSRLAYSQVAVCSHLRMTG